MATIDESGTALPNTLPAEKSQAPVDRRLMGADKIIEPDKFEAVGTIAERVVAQAKPEHGHALAEPRSERLPALTPMDMINQAVSRGADIAILEKLMGLQERWEANQGRKAFDNAMAAAKAEIPVIVKNRVVDFTSTKGRTHYRHEDLAEIARTVDPILAKYGLSYRFRTMSPPTEPVTVTCIVSHRDGYSEENTLSAGRDESGNKNSIQSVGSTITYLQRYSLKAALGLAAAQDDDAKAVGSTGPTGPITDDQVKTIRALCEETGTDIPKFCELVKVDSIPELPAAEFARVIASLEAKKRRVAS